MNLREVDKKFRKAMVEGVNECSKVVAVRMIENVPEDTGTLKSDIHPTKAKIHGDVIKGYATVGDEQIDYAVEVEFGSAHNAAQPFARPAARQTKKQRLGIIKDAAKKAL